MRRGSRIGAWVIAAVVIVVAVLATGWRMRAGARSTGSSRRDRGTDDEPTSASGHGVAGRIVDSAARSVSATVVDSDGEPLEGGHVSLRCLDDDEVAAIAPSALALDDDGHFESPGCRGRVCVELHHPTAIAADPWVLDPGEPATLRAVGLPRLAGTVVDARGRPVAGARVHVRTPADGDPSAMVPTVGTSTTSDIDGVFSFALIRRPPCDVCTEIERGCDAPTLALHERVVLAVNAEGFAPARLEIDVDAEAGTLDTPEIRLGRPTDAISGALADAQGNAYPRASVLARASDDPTDQHTATTTGTTFVFESLGTGPYDLRAIQDGVELATAARVWPGDDLELVGRAVATGPDVELLVVEDGLPVGGVAIDGGPFRGARTDVDGRVRAHAAMPGDYVLTVRPAGRDGQRRTVTVPVPNEASIAARDAELQAGPPNLMPNPMPDLMPDLVRLQIDLGAVP